MRIEHSILWLMVSMILIFITVWQELADQIAFSVGIDYPPSLYFVIAIIFSLIMLFYYSVEISKLKEQNKTLNQELAILRCQLEENEDKIKKSAAYE
jgi:hypothetical protein